MQNKTKEIAMIRQAVRLQEWSELIKAQQASGLTIKQWCEENGIKPNTYYCRLKKIREQFVEAPAIVPLNVPQQHCQSEIRILFASRASSFKEILCVGQQSIRDSGREVLADKNIFKTVSQYQYLNCMY